MTILISITDEGSKSDYEDANTLHVWFVSDASGACGYASFPGGSDRSTLQNNCAVNGTTFEHELGHNFGLPHTHSSGELVARPGSGKPWNCDSEGDGFCDTPADPSLSGAVSSSSCLVVDDLGTDDNGDPYQPDPHNIMSYASKSCRSRFSEEQLAYMNWVANNHWDRNKFRCEDLIEPDFEILSPTACNGDIQFIDISRASQGMTFEWSFEGGTPSTSTEENPSINFPSPGQYEIELRTTNTYGSETILKTIDVKKTEGVQLPFTEDFSSGSDALDNFGIRAGRLARVIVDDDGGRTNQGLILDGGDNSIFHTKPVIPAAFYTNPHYNSSAGLYCVDLTSVLNPTLSFDYKLLYAYNKFYTNFRVTINGEEIAFYRPNSSSDEKWESAELDLSDFQGQVVNIVFEGSSKYHYKYDGNGNGVFIDNINIFGSGTLTPEAEFSKNNAALCNDTYQFEDQSLYGPTTWEWTFEGGTPATSSDQNPVVVYNRTGTYDVSLTVSNANGSSTLTKENFVEFTNGLSLPFSESFSATFPPDGWSISNLDDGLTWEKRSDYGNPAGSMIMNNADNSNTGEIDEIVLPSYNFSNASHEIFTFDVAYTKYDDDSPDELRIFSSVDCGATWNEIWMKDHHDLQTVEVATNQSNDWVPEQESGLAKRTS